MTPQQIINTAMAHRFMNPPELQCGCCGGILHAEDHMGDHFTEEHTEAVKAEFGPNVCNWCANAFEPPAECEYCGSMACTCDDAYDFWVKGS